MWLFFVALAIVFVIGGLIAYPFVRANRRREAEERDRQQIERRLVRRLEGFGYTVKLEPAA